ncbi:Putative auto-transporter adhesin, head GIN domain [Lutibacter agarilyticus]|uniref:Putative auto-transporter adhesin, head GIN domain n=1 Tax=Lutibacter agarilyticus TaxID=1109740 RepID=A0A238WW36_9FLAO|nr:head GIN domain-containing protein [Lutibacter agarilyticus]SNR50696.1 Putative auto-transporter adhesin, head GIN domain [Lutibacter agarilyticus]
MKTITPILITFLLLISTTSFAQKKKVKGNSNIITTTRTVDNFDNIAVSGSFNVTLIKGKAGTITIEASSNLMEAIETEVKDGLLKIKFKSGWNIRTYKKVNITVTFETVSGVSLSGSGSIISADEIIANNLDLKVSGSGNMKLKLFTDQLTAAISGSGNLKLHGETNIVTCSISGSGNLNASDLKATITNAKVSGSGNVKIQALEEIHAKVSGSGNILYSGNPSIIKANASGSGAVKKMN